MHPSWPLPAEVAALADQLSPLIRFGCSSWTYPGWTGLIYDKPYPATGAGAKMLAEYARWPLFRTVGIDSFFYTPPSERTLASYAATLPADFRCVSKVWDRITAHTFANPKERAHFGQPNPDWLNADLFTNEVLGPMQAHFAEHIGPFVFEFQTIARTAKLGAADFAMRLDAFFGQLPRGVPYAVELRNQEYLGPEYFAVLRTHGVAHLFNSWTRMPTIGEQFLLHDAITADFLIARALLRPGRTYSTAVIVSGAHPSARLLTIR